MRAGGIESLPVGAGVVQVGGDGFVMPWSQFRATPAQMARIEVVGLIWESAAFADIRRQLLGEIESEMAKEDRRRRKMKASAEVEGRRVAWGVDAEDPPVALASGKAMSLRPVEVDGGRVYSPMPYRTPDPVRAPIMAKFERGRFISDNGVPLTGLTEGQLKRLRAAEHKLASAEGRRAARQTINGRGRMTQAEREERIFARDEINALAAELGAKLDRNAVQRARTEGLTLERIRYRVARCQHLQELRREWAEEAGVAAGALPALFPKFAERLALVQLKLKQLDELKTIVGEDGIWRRGEDGLVNLLASGTLDMADCAAGVKYRGLYLLTERSLGSAMGERTGGQGDDGSHLERCADALVRRKEIEAAVMATKNPRALTALRLVAGEGRTVNAISGGKSSNRVLNTKALVLALRVVREVIR